MNISASLRGCPLPQMRSSPMEHNEQCVDDNRQLFERPRFLFCWISGGDCELFALDTGEVPQYHLQGLRKPRFSARVSFLLIGDSLDLTHWTQQLRSQKPLCGHSGDVLATFFSENSPDNNHFLSNAFRFEEGP